MRLQVKLKNTELWITAHNKKAPEETANLLQLKFIGEMIQESSSMTKTFSCSNRPPRVQRDFSIKMADLEAEEEASEHKVDEVRTLWATSEMQLNLDQLEIEHLLVEKWLYVHQVIWQLFSRQFRDEFYVDVGAMEQDDIAAS
mmetsp:Transcript_18162/g.27942  ORF Transcript_18162/g.27942 Transcript_18162/m.27942 type:complete len:143 (+) Transcript_18162:4269-4697(+)